MWGDGNSQDHPSHAFGLERQRGQFVQWFYLLLITVTVVLVLVVVEVAVPRAARWACAPNVAINIKMEIRAIL
ncbi:hypothetical protein EBT23_07360 [bacterium]|nr:hypothetical protein [Verrucomicrobiota bacterium]NBS55353.1 hypothetical protein [bacterium]